MNRKQKEITISSLVRDFSECEAAFVLSVKLDAQKTQLLKKKLHGVGGRMFVAKNTLLRRAALNAPVMQPLLGYFKNQIMLVFAGENFSAVASVIKKNGYGTDILVNGGLLNGKLITHAQFEFVATIPSREVLYAQLCGALQSPMASLVYVLKTISEKEQ